MKALEEELMVSEELCANCCVINIEWSQNKMCIFWNRKKHRYQHRRKWLKLKHKLHYHCRSYVTIRGGRIFLNACLELIARKMKDMESIGNVQSI